MHVNTNLSDQEIAQAAQDKGLRLSMLSDYCIEQTVRNTHYAVINIASVESGKIDSMVGMLSEIFAEDIKRHQKTN